jgi:hypothetical protein
MIDLFSLSLSCVCVLLLLLLCVLWMCVCVCVCVCLAYGCVSLSLSLSLFSCSPASPTCRTTALPTRWTGFKTEQKQALHTTRNRSPLDMVGDRK